MALFPKIQSPCPYKDQLASVMDGDQCRLCKRQVFDLTEMTDEHRVSFMAGCAAEVCVSYRLPLRPALAAAAAAAALATPMAAAAQDAGAAEPFADIEVMVIVGGIKDLSNVEYVDTDETAAAPELPVVYEAPGEASTGTTGQPVSPDAP